MKLIRSCLFNVYYVLVTLIICVIGMIVGPFSMKLCCLNARLWGFLLLFKHSKRGYFHLIFEHTLII